ncbi:hypothetical protein [Streptomyces sp. ALI-76-A]|uniref:hypothetical protein n=1 Tax=Streptomyces sp. ALI-76-A TaxID=3025736 RepID=UPI00256EE98E|nr:hypothetical protein [Streptomyces sp. ALI-76-A]MDL5203522.1 hypothetical protein [Streptomyces sp. ALI-76-A]
MGRAPQDDGTYGAYGTAGARGAGAAGASWEGPKVYHPRAESTPAYDEYADPAVAHGWQNAYDETRELPRIDGAEPAPVPRPVPPAAPGRGAGPGRRRAPREPGGWRSRRGLVAVGAVGAVSAAALIVGFSFSGSFSGGARDKESGTRSVPDGSAGPTDPRSSAGPSGSPDTGSHAGAPSAGVAAPPGAPAGETGSAGPSAPSVTEAAIRSGPPPTATAASPSAAPSASKPGNSDGKGRGPGHPKGPK